MKKLILLLLPLFSLGQELNKTNDGYTEVVDIELSKKEIYQKLNEWVAISYNSAKDVIQLNTENKIILKGNFRVNFNVTTTKKYSFEYIISNSLSFSIRENKYKIDLKPSGVQSALDMSNVGLDMVIQYISSSELSKDEFVDMLTNMSTKVWLEMGYSEKKIQKMLDKYTLNNIDDKYADYIYNKGVFDSEINLIFDSVKNYVSSSNLDDEDW